MIQNSETESNIDRFIEEMEMHGKSARTCNAYKRVLTDFQEFLSDKNKSPKNAEYRDCMEWVYSLRSSNENEPSTIATYSSYVNRFYEYMTRVDEIQSNPMRVVMEEMEETIDTDPERREIKMNEMRDFVNSITHPLERSIITFFLKTGIRVGELCNLDLRDINLEGVINEEFYSTTRPAIENRSNTIYIDSSISKGDKINREERTASNKRKRDTIIPIDDEMKRVLLQWLMVRPSAIPKSKPLFIGTKNRKSKRMTPSMVRKIVRRHARKNDWYKTGGKASTNVTPHYFRHFFTTYLREETGDRGIVKYLRGDVSDDIIDTYTHNWGNRIETAYKENIFKLFNH